MALPLLDWYESGLATMASSVVADALTALKDAVDARVAGSPSTAMWQVASSELVAAAKYVVLKPTTVATSAGAEADMRVMCFGGSTPNASVTSPYTANAGYLYIGIAPDAGVDTPDVAYTSGVPFTTGSWQAAILTTTFTSLNRVGYWEYVGGIIVMVRTDVMTTTSRIALGMAGEMASSLDHNTLYYYLHGGYTTLAAAVDTNVGSSAGNWVQPEDTTSIAYSGSFYSIDKSSWTRAAAIFGPRHNSAGDAWKNDGSNRYFLPVYCKDIGVGFTKMKLRQIAYGPTAIYGTTLIETVSGDIAKKLGTRTDTPEHGPWLLDFNATC